MIFLDYKQQKNDDTDGFNEDRNQGNPTISCSQIPCKKVGMI
jgi:hypothetical protein